MHDLRQVTLPLHTIEEIKFTRMDSPHGAPTGRDSKTELLDCFSNWLGKEPALMNFT
jgi:hypothetical protein